MHAEPYSNEAFLGRREELQALMRRAAAAGTAAGESALLTGARGAGKTALLRQLVVHLFWKQDRVAPFLYPCSAAFLDAADFARDYLATFLRHRLAFEHRDHSMLSAVGMPLRELAAQAADRGAPWAWEAVERFQQGAGDPLAQLQTALHAPARSAGVSGKPVLVMLDDFPTLAGLHRAGAAEPSLLALFQGPVAARQAPHILAGSLSAFRELPLPVLTAVPLHPLPSGDAEHLFRKVLEAHGLRAPVMPRPLVDLLNGNPLYVCQVAGAVAGGADADEEALWSAYLGEITEGGLSRHFAGRLAALFPAWDERRNALEVLHRLYTAGTDPSSSRAVQAYIAEKLSAAAFAALLRAGLVCGEFGGYLAPEDEVLRDIVVLRYEREIAGRPYEESIRRVLAGRHPGPEGSWDLAVPLVPRAELVVAGSLEQIGKNLHIAEDTIGQLQMAVIEACINAIEHTKGGDRRLYVSLRALPDRLEISIESPGQEFVDAETGEPFGGTAAREGSPRGQGIRLMKRFADSVRFERTTRGTKVVLVKRLSRTNTTLQEGVHHHE